MKFVQCELCKTKRTMEMCGLAAYQTEIEGEKYVFCCQMLAQRLKKKKSKASLS